MEWRPCSNCDEFARIVIRGLEPTGPTCIIDGISYSVSKDNMAFGFKWESLKSSAEAGCPRCSIFRDALACFFPEDGPIRHHTIVLRASNGPERAFYVDLSANRKDMAWFGAGYKVKLYAHRGPDLRPWPLVPEPADIHTFKLEAKFQFIEFWLGNCVNNHSTCCSYDGTLKEGSTPLPSRVLDVSPADCELRLCEPRNVAARYVCLSHRWGNSQPLTTTVATLETRKRSIPFDTVPKTFQDAVIVTRKLGIRYLWIDSLCIIQDDLVDWEEQASSMCDIYKNAFLTLAATRCESCTEPLLPSFCHAVDGVDEVGSPLKIGVRIECFHLDNQHSMNPLLTRGWVFQERLLSRRILHFGFDELFWECMEGTSCECAEEIDRGGLPIKSIRNRIPPGATDKDLQNIWHELIHYYTDLSLTKLSDRLVAILGLAKEMQPHRKGRYVAGLWQESMIADLAWEVYGWGAANSRPPQEETLAPTWSWASVNCACEYSSNWIDGDTIVLAVQAPNPAKFPADRRALGGLTLKGRLITGKSDNRPLYGDRENPHHQWLACSFSGWQGRVFFTPDCADDPDTRPAIPDGEPVFCLALGYDSNINQNFEVGLVMRLVDQDLQLYERIGLAKIIRSRQYMVSSFDHGVDAIINIM